MYTKNKILEIFIAILGEGEIKFFLEPRPLTLVRETVDTEQSWHWLAENGIFNFVLNFNLILFWFAAAAARAGTGTIFEPRAS